MTSASSSDRHGDTRNPFPPAAVARISDLRPEVPTIRTAAVREIDSLIDGYLARTTPPDEGATERRTGRRLAQRGQVVVIDGDYGVGKTHLAIEILDRVGQSRAAGAEKPRVIYHTAPGGTFLTLYTDLLAKAITSEDVLEVVVEVYADIVADALREYPFAGNLVEQLERGDVDPQLVIERYGLKEGRLRQVLREQLSVVTGDEAYTRALMLLLQPDFRDAAWRWFRGGAVEQILLEHGVTWQIDTDQAALDALGVIALLYGRVGRRFVLIIDEMEKLVLTWDRSPQASAQAFKRMLEVFGEAGALLVVCGLPDMFEALPKDPGRIDAVIQPSALTASDVRWYIEETQARAFGYRSLEPFTGESVDYLIYLTGGVAREVLRFCYRAYDQALASDEEITPAVIQRIAHNLAPGGGKEMVRDEIARTLSDQGRLADRHRPLGDSPLSVVDFWLPVGDRRGGCAILLTDSALEVQHVSRLEEQLAAITSADSDEPAREIILVVSGYLAADLRPRLETALGNGSLIVYHARSFADDLTAAVNSAISRLGHALGENLVAGADDPSLQTLREETERIGRQQASTLRLVQELSSRILTAGIASEERLDSIQKALEGASSSAGDTGGPPPRTLSPVLEDMFSEAQRSLAAYGDLRKLLDDTFATAAQTPGAGFAVTYRLREAEVFAGIGVAAFLADLLLSLRESTQTWLNSSDTGAEAGPTPIERERLRGICRTFDALYAAAPLFKLDTLPEVMSLSDDELALLSSAGRSSRRRALIAAFEGLGDRVYETAVFLAGGADDTARRIAN
jgi:hypothetical protein